MYVKYGTTVKEIKQEIEAIEMELNESTCLSACDRQILHEELDYLYSFLSVETWQEVVNGNIHESKERLYIRINGLRF